MNESNGKIKFARMRVEKVSYDPLLREYFVEAQGLDCKFLWKFKSEFSEVKVGDEFNVAVKHD